MKTAEEILSKHTGKTGIYLTHGMIRGSDALEAMGEYLQQSQPSPTEDSRKVKLCLASINGALDGLEFDNTSDVIEKHLVVEQLSLLQSILNPVLK